jgi:Flp pilus assembly secretin CpaC
MTYSPLRRARLATLFSVVALAAGSASAVSEAHSSAGQTVTFQTQDLPPTTIIRSQHRRLPFTTDIERIAVGDAEILSAELITSREVLVLAREYGRTTLLVWFTNGLFREFLFSVERDLAVLERALRTVHPSIRVESAPDRDALVLTGTVPDILVSQSAEAVARNYLDAGARGGTAAPSVAIGSGAPPPPDPAGVQPPGLPQTGTPAQPQPAAVQLQGVVQSSGTIINLLQLETLPPLPEEKILEAIQGLGGRDVTIRRMLRGNVRDDANDTLVLEGRVPNQVSLVRVLTVAAQMFAGQTLTSEDIRVVADEAGALANQGQGQGQSGQQGSGAGGGLGGGSGSSLFGGSRGGRLTNQVRTNLARAKAIDVAGGRVLSFIEVIDLPQVRVDIRLAEVNRSKLRSLDPNAVLAISDFRQPSLNPAQSATTVQGEQAARVGGAGAAIQNVLSFLNGGLLNELQYAGSHWAIDAALSALERQGIARSLSSPSITVLSGESAEVQVGGEVPVPTAFAPAFGAGAAGGGAVTPGIFSSVEFIPFGVQLQIRPLVGDDDSITLDVQPQIVTPDALLTDTIRQATGTSVPTTAFQTRALRTSSRLQDGQSLLIGGLVSNNTSTNTASTPGLRDVPLLGRLFQSFNRNDQTTELIVVVNPVVLRAPVPDAALWAFPDRSELLRPIIANTPAAPPKP